MNRHLLSIYLNDHLAMIQAEAALTRRMQSSNRDSPLEHLLCRHADQVHEQRRSLELLMDRLHIKRNRVKLLGAQLGELFGRLKLNGRLLSYSPLSRMLELEGLSLAVEARAALWGNLAALRNTSLAIRSVSIKKLLSRTHGQKQSIGRYRRQAAVSALT